MFTKLNVALLLSGAFLITSCKKDDKEETPTTSNPTTYNFADTTAGFAKGDTVFLMLSELGTKMNYVKTVGNTLEDATMKNMLTGTGFTNTALNTTSFALEDLVTAGNDATLSPLSVTAIDVINVAIDSLKLNANPVGTAAAPTAGTIGTAGVMTVSGSTSAYVVNKYGYEYQQLIDKGLMGSLIYFQITNELVSSNSIGTSVAQADKIKNWDLAFKLFGVPSNYNTLLTSGLTNAQIRAKMKYFGAYAFDRKNDAKLPNAIGDIYNAFIAGRVAINNNDQATLDAQVTIIQREMEKVWTATMIKYIDDAVGTTDNARINHSLSELLVFIKGLQYNGYSARVTNTEITTWLATFNHTNILTQGVNFYEVDNTELNALRTTIATKFGYTF
ncbi:MAG: DUF4856 domain-containing protein [Cytophagaceae bacterium]